MRQQLVIWLEAARSSTSDFGAWARRTASAAGAWLLRTAEQLEAWLSRLAQDIRRRNRWEGVRPALRQSATALGAAAVEGWRWVRPPLVFALQVIAALIVLFEEWGWRPLTAFLASLTRFAVWARLERFIAGLPPYGALMALGLPTSVLFPLKLLAVYLLAQGQALAATALFVAAKIASTALIARIFMLTKPALMQIGWFAAAYDWIVPWQQAMFAMIRASWPWRYGRMVKTRVRLEVQRAWTKATPRLADAMSRARSALRAAWIAARPQIARYAAQVRSLGARLRQRLSRA